MIVGAELLVVKVEDPDLFARLLWTAQRDPIAALAAIHVLGEDARVQVLTDSVVRTGGEAPAQLTSEWRTPAGGRFELLVTELRADGDHLSVHLGVVDPDIDYADAPSLGVVRRIDQDFTVDLDADILPVVPAPQVLALVWPTTGDSEPALREAVMRRSAEAERRSERYDTETVRQRRSAVDQLLVW